MAMITCKECGKEISSTAERCPHCGCKTRYGKETEDSKRNSTALWVGLALVVIGAILFFPACMTMIEEADNWYFWNVYREESNAVIWKLAIGAGMLAGGGYCMRTVVKK